MPSSKTYLDFILDQLSDLEDISYRAMVGEFIIYYRGKIVGGIYDDRLLVKAVSAAIAYMPDASYELPYECAPDNMQRIPQPLISEQAAGTEQGHHTAFLCYGKSVPGKRLSLPSASSGSTFTLIALLKPMHFVRYVHQDRRL